MIHVCWYRHVDAFLGLTFSMCPTFTARDFTTEMFRIRKEARNYVKKQTTNTFGNSSTGSRQSLSMSWACKRIDVSWGVQISGSGSLFCTGRQSNMWNSMNSRLPTSQTVYKIAGLALTRCPGYTSRNFVQEIGFMCREARNLVKKQNLIKPGSAMWLQSLCVLYVLTQLHV